MVVGNAGLDTLVFIDSDSVDLSMDSQFTRNIDVVGQAGAYSSRGFARLGRRTRFLGALADDAAGRMVREALEGDGVDISAVFEDPAGTARSVNLIPRDGSRRAFYDGRGHMTLEPPMTAAAAAVAGARLIHVHLANWARLVLPLSQRVAPDAVVSVDLQDVREVTDPYRADFVAAADVLFLSAANLADPVGAAEALLERSGRAGIAVVGLGREGALTVTPLGREHHPIPDLDLPVVDTNGAGDGLATGFLDAYALDGTTVAEAVLRGQLAARWTCAQVGGGDLIDRPRLRQLLRAADTTSLASD